MSIKNEMEQYDSKQLVCGCDEAGRGALAGPVVAAAVILPKKFLHRDLNDSKKINAVLRQDLSKIIKKKSIGWGIGIVSAQKIDEINILNASLEAMHRAITSMIMKIKSKKPDLLLIDGNRFKKYKNIMHKCIIKGDGKYYSIAAASILAKTYRDNLMRRLSKKTPEYNWSKNKGYPTKEHKMKIIELGVSKYHRKSFKLLDLQYVLKL